MSGSAVASMPVAEALLVATIAAPLALLLACAIAPLRRIAPALLALAALPALVTALTVPVGTSTELGTASLLLTLTVDAPGRLLLGTCALLWMLAGAYAWTYMHGTHSSGRFVACWLSALTGCLGSFVAGDLISLYALLALLTLGATGLVIHEQEPGAWRSGAIYFGLAVAAESVLLVGLILLAQAMPGERLLVRDAVALLPTLPDRDLIVATLLGGFGLKAGLVPLHVWMPLAHAAAPVPASSVLSGAVVKVGVIGLIRFLPLDHAWPAVGITLTVIGFATAYLGVLVGITQSHPKSVLAYSSVSQMGVVAAVLGMGLAAGDAGSGLTAAYYASHHVLVKGALFLAVGVIAAGGAGVRAWVLVPALLLSLSLGGLPPTGGALAKYAVKEQLDVGVVALLSALSAIGTTVLMLHFVRRLAAFGSRDATQRAGAGLTLPWLAAALAALLVPWWLYPSLDAGPVTATLTYAAVGAAVWPVLAGAALAALLSRHGERLPRIPAGDLVVLAERAAPALRGLGQAVAGFDAIVARWPVATAAAIAVAIGFGALLTR